MDGVKHEYHITHEHNLTTDVPTCVAIVIHRNECGWILEF